MNTQDYDEFLDETCLEVHAQWEENGGRELTPKELQQLNDLLDGFFQDKVETMEQAVRRCSDELAETGETKFMGKTIKPAFDQQYTVTGYDKYGTVRSACCAIKKEKQRYV